MQKFAILHNGNNMERDYIERRQHLWKKKLANEIAG